MEFENEAKDTFKSNIENLKNGLSWDLFEKNMKEITRKSYSKSRCLAGLLMKELKEKLENNSEDDKNEWKVRKIKDKRVDKDGASYKIAWEDSWEPKKNLNCLERIAEFEDNLIQNKENLQQLGKRKSEHNTTNARSPLSKRSKSPRSNNR